MVETKKKNKKKPAKKKKDTKKEKEKAEDRALDIRLKEAQLRDMKKKEKGNEIMIHDCGIQIKSNQHSLKELETIANRLAKEHKDFMVFRKKNQYPAGVG
ncbi:unnamed protein product [marine sediment metagenome]|uniref:Uncharacterized protein n=1 Tax=marine sediment metagenome TaxID=412755 RepID=X1A0B5_9ZZZZ